MVSAVVMVVVVMVVVEMAAAVAGGMVEVELEALVATTAAVETVVEVRGAAEREVAGEENTAATAVEQVAAVAGRVEPETMVA